MSQPRGQLHGLLKRKVYRMGVCRSEATVYANFVRKCYIFSGMWAGATSKLYKWPVVMGLMRYVSMTIEQFDT